MPVWQISKVHLWERTTFERSSAFKLVFAPFWKRSALKRKNLHPPPDPPALSPFRVLPISEGTRYTRKHTGNHKRTSWQHTYIILTPLNPTFIYTKTGDYRGINYFFLFLLKHIDCGYSLEPPRRGGSNEYSNLYFDQKYEKYQNVLSKNFHFLVVKFSAYLNRRVFVMTNVDSFVKWQKIYKVYRVLLTLKMPRKTTSENVDIIICRLLHFLANFSNILFAYRQTVWPQIRLLLEEQSGSTLFAKMT